LNGRIDNALSQEPGISGTSFGRIATVGLISFTTAIPATKLFFSMDLSLLFCLAVAADFAVLRSIPRHRRIARFVFASIFFAIQTVLIVALVGSPFRPIYRPRDLPREFWLQILMCCWWGLAARELVSLVALPTAIRKTAIENKLLSDVIAASTYVCSALAMIGFVFGVPLQGLVATSGIIAIVLGLALQSTLGDVFSGLSLSIEKPYRVGDEILFGGRGRRRGDRNELACHAPQKQCERCRCCSE
jgi:small-conductance mechanosensitive channel